MTLVNCADDRRQEKTIKTHKFLWNPTGGTHNRASPTCGMMTLSSRKRAWAILAEVAKALVIVTRMQLNGGAGDSRSVGDLAVVQQDIVSFPNAGADPLCCNGG